MTPDLKLKYRERTQVVGSTQSVEVSMRTVIRNKVVVRKLAGVCAVAVAIADVAGSSFADEPIGPPDDREQATASQNWQELRPRLVRQTILRHVFRRNKK